MLVSSSSSPTSSWVLPCLHLMGKKLDAASGQEGMDGPIVHGIYLAISKLDKYKALTKVNHSWILATGMLLHVSISLLLMSAISLSPRAEGTLV
jgi:hypothetical protein